MIENKRQGLSSIISTMGLILILIIMMIIMMGFMNYADAANFINATNLSNTNPHVAVAEMCNPQSGGQLDNMVFDFVKNSTSWIEETNKIAHKIFMLLFAMEFLWQLVVKKVFTGDIEKLWVFFLARIILGLFFAKYIINVELYKGIIQYMAGLGMHIAKLGLDPSSVKLTDLGPSRIMGYFACVSDAVHKITDDVGTFEFITLKMTLVIMQVLLFVILSMMAYCVIVVYIQMYFLLYAGFILTGFAGSSWTFGYWQKYIQTVSYIAIKFFVICILMGMLMTAMTSWSDKFVNVVQNYNVVELAAVFLNVLGTAIILGMTMWQLPDWAATALSATINVNLQDRMVSVARAASGGK